MIIGPLKNEKFKFNFKQKYDPEVAKKLFQIENHEPKEPSILMLNNVIKKLLEKQDLANQLEDLKISEEETKILKNDIEDDVIKAFEKYIQSKIAYVKFIAITVDIAEHHAKDDLTEEYLNEVIENNWG